MTINFPEKNRSAEVLFIDVKQHTVTFDDSQDGTGTAPLLNEAGTLPTMEDVTASINAVIGTASP